MTTTAPRPQPSQRTQGVGSHLEQLLDRLQPANDGTVRPARDDRLMTMAKSALPFAAMAARRVPVGLAVLGLVAAGVALSNPTRRAKILDAGRRGLDAIRR